MIGIKISSSTPPMLIGRLSDLDNTAKIKRKKKGRSDLKRRGEGNKAWRNKGKQDRIRRTEKEVLGHR